MTALVLVAVGVVAGVVYCHARHALAARLETVDRAPRQTLPGYCADCGSSELSRNGRCAVCSSDAVWTPGSLTLPTYAAVGKSLDQIQRHAAIAARVRLKHGAVSTESKVQS